MLNYIIGESIYDHCGSKLGDQIIEKLQNDNRFTKFEDCFFFDSFETEQIQEEYPKMNLLFKNEYAVQSIRNFIETFIFDDEEFTYINSLAIPNDFITDVMIDHFWCRDEVFERFATNPEQTLNEVKKEALNYTASVMLGEMLKDLKGSGIEIDNEVVQDAMNA